MKYILFSFVFLAYSYETFGQSSPTTSPILIPSAPVVKRNENQEPTFTKSNNNWTIGTNFRTSMFLDRYFNDQQLRLQIFYYGKADMNDMFQNNKFGIDIERVFATNNGVIDASIAVGPSIRYQYGWYTRKDRLTVAPLFNSYYYTDSIRYINNLFVNIRTTAEIIIYDRWVLHGSMGCGYSTQAWGLVGDPSNSAFRSNIYSSGSGSMNFDYEFFIGYRFGISL